MVGSLEQSIPCAQDPAPQALSRSRSGVFGQAAGPTPCSGPAPPLTLTLALTLPLPVVALVLNQTLHAFSESKHQSLSTCHQSVSYTGLVRSSRRYCSLEQ
ncbi:UNVERIFIED_CONTAM: hypothetical protein FKN15_036250 [Acipenser sinensis]